jgi:hypothetical protein
VAGCGPREAPALVEPFVALHRAVIVAPAFEEDRDRLWTHLAGALDGRALTDAYVAAWVAGRRRAADGVRLEVLRVDHDDVVAWDLGGGRAHVDASWSVGGRLTHRGHSHVRVHRYTGRYTLAAVGDGWRIVDVAPRDVRAVDADGPRDAFDLIGDPRGGFVDPLDLPELRDEAPP